MTFDLDRWIEGLNSGWLDCMKSYSIFMWSTYITINLLVRGWVLWMSYDLQIRLGGDYCSHFVYPMEWKFGWCWSRSLDALRIPSSFDLYCEKMDWDLYSWWLSVGFTFSLLLNLHLWWFFMRCYFWLNLHVDYYVWRLENWHFLDTKDGVLFLFAMRQGEASRFYSMMVGRDGVPWQTALWCSDSWTVDGGQMSYVGWIQRFSLSKWTVWISWIWYDLIKLVWIITRYNILASFGLVGDI